jgi:hypothetical protein
MDVASLFTLAMGMTPPWKVVEVKFDEGRRRLDLRVDFPVWEPIWLRGMWRSRPGARRRRSRSGVGRR